MVEIWLSIEGYFDSYQVSNRGRVKNKKRKNILKPKISPDGYLRVGLSKDGHQKFYYIHRLVAQTFIPNPDNKPQVNHINRNKQDNHLWNLEWCTARENQVHRFKYNSNNDNKKYGTLIKCVTTNKIYYSIAEAAEDTGACYSSITKCCKGDRKTAGGYEWEYLYS